MSEQLVVSLPEDQLIDALDGMPGVEFVHWDMSGPPPREDIDIVTVPYLEGPQILSRLEGMSVRLVQGQSIGFDGVAEHLAKGVQFANATSVHEASTAELAVGLAIAMQRGIPEAVRNADKNIWAPGFHTALADQRVLLVGYGGVAKAIEARLVPFEVEIIRLASRARIEHNLAGEDVQVHGVDELHDLLSGADVVVISLPLANSTQNLFDGAAFAAMKRGALLINVGRGGVVDTDALVDALRNDAIRAGLDVVDPEPLPADHPLRGCPGLLITPHVGGDTSARLPRIAALIRRQIAHLQVGESPENLVFERQ